MIFTTGDDLSATSDNADQLFLNPQPPPHFPPTLRKKSPLLSVKQLVTRTKFLMNLQQPDETYPDSYTTPQLYISPKASRSTASNFTYSSTNSSSSSSSSSSSGSGAGNSKESLWYQDDCTLALKKQTRRLFEEYSKIPSEKVIPHILAVRERAWDIQPYACIGSFRFLDISIHYTTLFKSVLSRIKSGERLFDLGCCLGQDLRTFAFHGAPSENLFGADLYHDFIDLGFDLFADRHKFRGNFFVGDVFNSNELCEPELSHGMDIIHVGSFLHLFTWEEQLTVTKRIIGFLKQQPGVSVFGRQLGTTNPGNYAGRDHSGGAMRMRFRHDADSFQRLWKEAGDATGTSWIVDVELRDFTRVKEDGTLVNTYYGDRTLRKMVFTVTRS